MMSKSAMGFFAVAGIALALGGYRVLRPPAINAEPPNHPRKQAQPFAVDRDPDLPQLAAFDADRAMGYLQAICKIGPRISGSDGMKRQQDMIRAHFERLGATVTEQKFTAKQETQKNSVEMVNLIVSWHPDRPRRVILCSHYDTRPVADQEPNRRDWQKPFVSANDGGSGVALLMELGNHMKTLKPKVGVDFVFFDGEEYVFQSDRDRYFFGSEHFAEQYRKGNGKPGYVAAVLLDMIGGKNPRFPAEQHSLWKAGALVQDLWKIAADQGCKAFEDRVGPAVLDDHLALNQVGIPAADIIDFDYPHWHRLSDVPANCSGESLAQVAKVLATWVQLVK